MLFPTPNLISEETAFTAEIQNTSLSTNELDCKLPQKKRSRSVFNSVIGIGTQHGSVTRWQMNERMKKNQPCKEPSGNMQLAATLLSLALAHSTVQLLEMK